MDLHFFDLPMVMIEHILSFLNYDDIAKSRQICKEMDVICTRLLNKGWIKVERRHSFQLKTMKAQLPRRESERRYHPLSRHCDILSSIETRISMLNMTYAKYIDSGLCCFIPGRIIDEIRRVLYLVETDKQPPRAHEVLQELRDISSMAIEHFDDKISPAFKQHLRDTYLPTAVARINATHASEIAGQEMNYLRRRALLNFQLSAHLALQYRQFCKKVTSLKRMVLKQKKTIKDLTKKNVEQDAAIADLKKRIDECDIKYSELTHTNQAVGGKAISVSSSSVASGSAPAQPLRHFASQIKLDLSVLPIGTSKRNPGKALRNMKPRKPIIRLPSFSEGQSEPVQLQATPPSPSSFETRFQNNIKTINSLTKEIKYLDKANGVKLVKRSRGLNGDESTCKKAKLD